ncbi:maestro heat-like repeat family member 5 isoform X1 [Lontra canadensis]|uniref:maestro heat-like repeat family member 5 isoform X1 n=1 Tax=Lontra canadensis TaxID=76717 RepID=UPI0013F2BA79|nr:maestro heat-like repeat family member 5 isoform X1 [Lontra canadensis]
MAHYDCEVKAVLGQAVISLKSSEERDNIVAILIITEFLNSQELTQYVSRRTMDSFLSLGLNHPNQLVRAMSLKGLSSTLMHPKKVVLLRGRLAGLLDRFGKPEPKDLMGLMEILGDILHHLGTQGVGAASLKMAQHLLPLFEDEQAPVRGGAISLFGDVLHSGGRKYRPELKTFAFRALVPLLFHLADPCPDVAMNTKLTFLRCAILLKWEFRKELFGKLAWGHGLGAENDIFIYMVESNFGSYHQFLMQALHYLASPHGNLRRTAMKFIGGLLHDYFTDLCFSLKKGDLNVLRKHVEVLRQDPDSMSRRFYHSVLEDISELSQFVTH